MRVQLQRRKPAELVAYLALCRNPVVSRDVVAEALWPDTDAVTGRNRLKTTLSNLKQEVPGLPIVAIGKQYIELSRDQVVVDYEVYERQLRWRRAMNVRDRQSLSKRILESIRPRLLPGFDAAWALLERTRYDQLAESLGAELEGVSVRLDEPIFLGDDLEGLMLPLVGREEQLREVEAWLRGTEGARSLHIVGPPGVGKTRLLNESLQLSGQPNDLVLKLSTVQKSETRWLERLGAAIDVREPGRIAESLTQFLGDFSRPLIVVDDVDQGEKSMVDWLHGVLASVPHLRLLATARRQPSEPQTQVCRLDPLMDDAPELLTSFARHFGADKTAISNASNEICALASHLEGLPLALEVAGAWLPLIRPEALLRRLRSSSELLMEPSAHGRGSLTALMQSVFAQLEENDQKALLRLSLCQSGCGEKLAEELLGENWLWRLRTLSERSLALRYNGKVENRVLVLQALREAVKVVAGEEKVAAATEAWRESCLAVAGRVVAELNERDRSHYMNWLSDEGDNIIAACLASMSDPQKLVVAIEVCEALRTPFWLMGRDGSSREALEALQRAGMEFFPENGAETPTSIVRYRARKLQAEGQFEDAVRLIAAYRKSVEQSDNLTRLANALDREGDTRDEAGDWEGAIECWQRSSETLMELGRPRQALWLESKIGQTEQKLGLWTQSHNRRWAAMLRARELGDLNSLGVYLKAFATLAQENGDFEIADAFSKEALECFESLGESLTLFDAQVVRVGFLLARSRELEAKAVLDQAKLISPPHDEERMERLEILERLYQRGTLGQLFFKHIRAEH